MRKKVGLGKFSILIKITCVTEFYLYRIFVCIYTLVYTYIKKSIKVGHKILICVYFKVVEFQVIFTFSFLANVTQLGRGRARFQCSPVCQNLVVRKQVISCASVAWLGSAR